MKTFGLSLTLLAAAAVSGCDDRSPDRAWSASGATQLCTDDAGRRVAEELCQRGRGGAGIGYFPFFINRGGYLPPVGGYVREGSRTATSGLAYGRPAAFTASAPSGSRGFAGVSRGGFGASAHAGVGG